MRTDVVIYRPFQVAVTMKYTGLVGIIESDLAAIRVPPIRISLNIGSEYIIGRGCGKDTDILVLISPEYVDILRTRIMALGWRLCNPSGPVSQDDPQYPDQLLSYRAGKINLLFVWSESMFQTWLRCAEACRYIAHVHGITDKDTRVRIHQIIMDEEL